MYEEEIKQINKYCSPVELYVITPRGKLQKLNCPIQVICIRSIGIIKAGQLARATEVRITTDLVLVYVIGKSAYFYYFFRVVLTEK